MNALERLEQLRNKQAELDNFESSINPDTRGVTRRSASVGVDQLQSSALGALAAGADIVGADNLNDVLVDSMVDNSAQAAKDSAGIVTTLGQASAPEDYAEWALFNIVSQAPNMAAAIGTSVVTGGLGAGIARGAATIALKKEIGKEAAKSIANGVGKKAAMKAAAEKIAAKTIKTGQIAGFAVPSVGLNTGEIYGSIDQATGKTDEGVKAAITGSVAGLLDSIPLFQITKLAGISPKVVKEGIMQHLSDAGIKAVKAAGVQGGLEGSTEAAQTVIQLAAIKWVDSNLDVFTEENIDEIFESFASGTLLGVFTGGGGSLVGSIRTPAEIDPRVSEYLDTKKALPQSLPGDTKKAAEAAVKANQEQIRKEATYLTSQGDQGALINARQKIRALSARMEEIRALPEPEEAANDLAGDGPDIDLGLKNVDAASEELVAAPRLLAGNEKPWKTEKAAQRALSKLEVEGQYQVAPTEGGYALELIKQDLQKGEAAGANLDQAVEKPTSKPEAAPKPKAAELDESARLAEEKHKKRRQDGIDRIKKNKEIDVDNDDILMAIAKVGGIDSLKENDIAGRLPKIKTPFGVTNLDRPGKGLTLDELGELLIPHGYLKSTEVGNGVDAHDLLDLIERAASGEDIRSNHMDADKYMQRKAEEEAEQQKDYDDYLAQEFLALNPEYENSYLEQQESDSLPEEYYAQDIEREARRLTELVDDLERIGIDRQAITKTIKSMAEAGDSTPTIMRELFELLEAQSEKAERASTESSETSGEPVLSSYSEADIAEQEKAESDRKAQEREAVTRAEQQDTADDFVLSGSNREADQAAARGQEDLLSQSESGQTNIVDQSDAVKAPVKPDLKTPEGMIQTAIAGGMSTPDKIKSFIKGQNQVSVKLGGKEVEVTEAQINKALGITLDEKANEAATSPTNDLPEPTEAQKEAGNFKVGKIQLHGMEVSIENPKGSHRKGTDSDGKEWKVLMKHHYGYVRGSEAIDGDHVDVFINPNGAQSEKLQVYVVDQVGLDGKYDEPKVMIGFRTQKAAERGYLANYKKGWKGLGAITPMSIDDFKTWVASDAAKKPVGLKGKNNPNLSKRPDWNFFTRKDDFNEVLIESPNELLHELRLRADEYKEAIDDWRSRVYKKTNATFQGKDQDGETVDKSISKVNERKRHRAIGQYQYQIDETNKQISEVEKYLSQLEREKPIAQKKLDKNEDLDFERIFDESSNAPIDTKKSDAPEKAKDGEQKKPTEPKADKINDFGKKIGGARKDLAHEWAGRVSMDIDATDQPLSKVFPQPNYEKLEAEGVAKEKLAFVALARAEIPSKPRRRGVQRWADNVMALRKLAHDVMADKYEMSAFRNTAKANNLESMMDMMDVLVELPTASYQSITKNKVGFRSANKRNDETGEFDIPVHYAISKDRTIRTQTEAGTLEEAKAKTVEFFKAQIVANDGKSVKREKKRPELAVYRDRMSKERFIGFKSPGGLLHLKDGFTDASEAFKYIQENREALEKQIEEHKKGPKLRRLSNDMRTGPELRKGDISPERFASEFGFYGVEFGNYVEGPRRQKDLNDAFDAFTDMASAIGIPSQALSLNGSLGVAFGARGRGGNAAAHFEPTSIAINMTKKSGPGSLAHEWLHAMDNYFARKERGIEGRKPSSEFLSTIVRKKKAPEGIRQEVFDAAQSVVKSIYASDLPDRSSKIDAGRSKSYYNTTVEMIARSFEKYIIDRLDDSNIRNDYLANIDETGGAYPSDDEMQDGIRGAFDSLFDAIETRNNDGNIEMFSRPQQSSIPQDMLATVDNEQGSYATGKPVKMNYVHNTVSVTARDGKPRKGDRWSRNFEPSGMYVTQSDGTGDLPDGMVRGQLDLQNPLVIKNDDLNWKQKLSEAYGGKTGKELSKTLIADGYDAVITVDGEGSKSYVSETVDLTTFSEAKALYSKKQPTKATGVKPTKAIQVVNRIKRNWTNAPKIKVVQRISDIPGTSETDSAIRGIYRNTDGTVYIIADAHPDMQAVEATLLHEVQHFANRKAYGREAMSKLSALGQLIQQQGGVAEFVKSRGYDYDYDWYEQQFRNAGLPESARLGKHVDELLAVMASDKASGLGRVRAAARSALAAIRRWLRSLGFQLAPSLPDDQLVKMLNETQKVLTGGADPAIRPIRSRATNMHRVWHGSPHKFDKFSTDAMGTGEGAQAYGWGLYFTDTKEIADKYRQELSNVDEGYTYEGKTAEEYSAFKKKAINMLGLRIHQKGLTGKDAVDDVLERLKNGGFMSLSEKMKRDNPKVAKEVKKLDFTKIEMVRAGALYDVDLAPKQDEYLLWDEPISKQSELVQSALKVMRVSGATDGRDVYQGLQVHAWNLVDREASGSFFDNEVAKKASSMLLKQGIRGIKYLDGSSRSKGEGSYNYVIFDDADVVIEDSFNRPKQTPSDVEPVEKFTEVAIRKMMDKHRVLKGVVDNLRKTGKVTEDNDAYRAEELFHGNAENDLRKMRNTHIEPLAKVMASVGINMKSLDRYLYAKHAAERNAHIASVNPDMPEGGSGMSNADADAIIRSVSESGKQSDYDMLAQKVYDIIQSQRDVMRENGLESDDVIDAWESKYKFYVPLKGYAANETADGRPRTGSGYSIGGKESKRALGRKSEAASPTSYAINDLTEKLIRKRKNEVGNAFLNLVQDNPDARYWNVYTDENPETDRRMVKTKNGEEVREMPVPMAMMRDRYFTTKKDGVTYYIKLEDQRLMKSLNNIGPEASNGVMRFLAGYTRFLSTMNTSLNPEFVVTNFLRDIQTAGLNLSAEQTRDDGKAFGESLVKNTIRDVRKAMPGIWKVMRGKDGGEWGAHYEDFMANGGKTGWFDMKDIDGQAKDLENLIAMAEGTVKGRALRYFNYSKDVVEHMNGAVENAVRLSAYKNAVDAGISKPQAASLAKNMTVNFNRRGEVGTTLNALYMFANASIQGTANFARTMIGFNGDGSPRWKNMNNAQKLAVGMAAGSFTLAVVNRMFAGEDDDGENWYEKVPDYVKERNIVIMKSLFGGPSDGSYFKIPLPYGYNVFSMLGTTIEGVLQGNTSAGKGATDTAIALLSSFSPIGFSDSETLAGLLLKNAAPTIAQPVVDLGLNENFFGSQIFQENFPFGAQKPASSLGRRGTAEPYKDLATWMNSVTGGSQYRSGAIDANPDVLAYLVSEHLGAAGNFWVGKAYDKSMKFVHGVDIDSHEVPFLGRVNGKVLPYDDRNKFYTRRKEIEQIRAEAKSLQGAAKQEFLSEYGERLDMRDLMKTSEKQLKKLRERRDMVYSTSVSRKEQDQRLDLVNRRMKAVVDNFNAQWPD